MSFTATTTGELFLISQSGFCEEQRWRLDSKEDSVEVCLVVASSDFSFIAHWRRHGRVEVQ